jgi:putative acetyltransferase
VPLRAERDDPRRPDVVDLLTEHLADMRAISPACSVHALDPDGLVARDVAFWTVREADVLLGCGALAPLDAVSGEVKSMRTARPARGRGVGSTVLTAVLAEAHRRGYRSVLLETGTDPSFAPARRLYERNGFLPSGPFGAYREDPHSAYYRLDIPPDPAGGMAAAPARF